MQLFIILDALRRASASRVHAVVPYFGYSRKEKKTQARDPISAKLMANFIENTGASRLIAVDLHADAIQGFFDIPVDALQATKILAKHCSDTVTHGDLIVVSPDVGGSGRARQLAKMLDVPMAIVDKRRPKDDSIEIVNVIGKVNNKHCIIVDDLISTGSTLIGASNALLNLGASKVDVVATHGVLAGNAKDNLTNSSLNSICITDTIPHEFTDLQKQKFVVVSVAPMIAEAIVRINEGRSVSELFK